MLAVTLLPSRSTTTSTGAPLPAASSAWTTLSAVAGLPLTDTSTSFSWSLPAEAEPSGTPAICIFCSNGMPSSLRAEATAFSCEVVIATALSCWDCSLVTPVGKTSSSG